LDPIYKEILFDREKMATKKSKGDKQRLPKEFQKMLKNITNFKKIMGIVIINSEGITVKSSLEISLATQVNSLKIIF